MTAREVAEIRWSMNASRYENPCGCRWVADSSGASGMRVVVRCATHNRMVRGG